jgi:hypothetical protein
MSLAADINLANSPAVAGAVRRRARMGEQGRDPG